jgi:lipoprotein-releasing system ATP-binding protein
VAQVLIRAEQLSKHYGEEEQAIQVFTGLNLDIRRAERIAIIGESGVGKSTLLHILGTLDQPSAGKVWLDGQDVFALPSEELAVLRNREIGFIFQFHHLLSDFSAVENVMLPGLIARVHRSEASRRAVEILEHVGLKDRLTHRPGELSGGEQQRVAVARALVLRPRVVLADEPTGNLDPETGEGVLQLLLDLNQTMNMTVVIVTHNEKVAGCMDRTLRLEAGRLHEVPPQAGADAVSGGSRSG